MRERGPDGRDYLRAKLVITDAATIAAIRAGTIKGISMGYACEHRIDASGRKRQINIRHDHVALLDARREQPRCGEHCSITKDNMPTRTTDAIQLDGTPCGCSAADQAERDRIDAWLDIASERTGVHKANIVTALSMRADAASADVTRDLINETAAALARQPNPARPAQWHDGRHAPASRADALSDDNAFRAHLARQQNGARQDAGGASSAVAAAMRARPALRGLSGLDYEHVAGTLQHAFDAGGQEQLDRVADAMAAARGHVAASNASSLAGGGSAPRTRRRHGAHER